MTHCMTRSLHNDDIVRHDVDDDHDDDNDDSAD